MRVAEEKEKVCAWKCSRPPNPLSPVIWKKSEGDKFLCEYIKAGAVKNELGLHLAPENARRKIFFQCQQGVRQFQL